MYYNDIHAATLEELTDELAAAGWDSTQTRLSDARDAVARLHNSTIGLELVDAETGETIRKATDDEAAESASSVEGFILVGDRKCCVTA